MGSGRSGSRSGSRAGSRGGGIQNQRNFPNY